MLLVSELVTNAVLHGKGTISLAIECGADGVQVCVGDGGGWDGHKSAPPAAGPAAERGRGLQLVAALADAWGTAPGRDDGRTLVWFRLS